LEEESFNIDNSERGEAKIMKKIFASVPDFKVIFIPMNDLISKIKNEEKIEFLNNLGFLNDKINIKPFSGIQMNIEKEKIDFLKMKSFGRIPKTHFYEEEDLEQIMEWTNYNIGDF